MINFTDVNPTLFASDGSFFYGKLVFLDPDTQKPKAVFDQDGVAYGSNVVTVNDKGRMSVQVFLDGAYDCQFWKFVGTQFDIDDPTQWAFDRSVRIIDPTKVELEISGDAILGTVADLRSVDNATEGSTMTVMGYYAAGDMTPQYYYWNPNSTATDDGGSVICPDGRSGEGRWLMIPQRVVDVRAFGVRPSSQLNTAVVNGNMAAAFNFANRYNRDLWFPKVFSSSSYSDPVYSYYAFDGGNLTISNNRLLVDNCVQFCTKAGTTNITVKEIVKNDRLLAGGLGGKFGTITCDTQRTVWGYEQLFSPRKRLVIDSARHTSDPLTLTRVEVVLEYQGYLRGFTFNKCTFVLRGGYLSQPNRSEPHKFVDCVFTDRLYSNDDQTNPLYRWMVCDYSTDSVPVKLVLENCKIEPVNQFDLPVNYVFAVLKNGGNTVDLEGKKLSFVGNSSVENPKKISNEVTFNNMELQVSLERYFSGSLVFNSCRFDAAPLDSGDYAYASFYDCVFNQSVDTLKVEQSNMFNCIVGCPVIIPTLIAEGCRFGQQVTVNENSSSSELNSCNFAEKVVVGALNGRVSVHATNNRFVKGLELGQSGQIQIYGCRFIGNYFESGGIALGSGVTIDQEEEQAYVYDGNRGAVPLNRQSGKCARAVEQNSWLKLHDSESFCRLIKVDTSKSNANLPSLNVFAFGKKKFTFTLNGSLSYGYDDTERLYRFTFSRFVEVNGSGRVSIEPEDYAVAGNVVTDFSKDGGPGIIETLGDFSDKFWFYPSLTWVDADKPQYAFSWTLEEIL